MCKENINESHYDIEHFFDYEQYQKLLKEQPEPMLPYFGDLKFEFYQFGFQNGVRVFLFQEKKMAQDFVTYMNFEENCIMCDHINNSIDRILQETMKRNSNDFIDLCKQLSDNKEFCVIYCPFKLNMMKGNPYL